MFFASESAQTQAARQARRKARLRSAKQRREVFKTAMWVFLLGVLATSLWTLRKLQRLEHGFREEREGMEERANRMTRGDVTIAEGGETEGVVLDAGGGHAVAGETRARENMAENGLERSSGEDGAIRNGGGDAAKREELDTGVRTATEAEAVPESQGFKVGEPQKVSQQEGTEVSADETTGRTPGLLTPAKERKEAERTEGEERKDEEEGGGDLSERKDEQVVEEEGAEENGKEVAGDGVADSLEDEEGGEAPVITLGKSGKDVVEKEGGANEEKDGDKEGDDGGADEGG